MTVAAPPTILVIDDDEGILTSLEAVVSDGLPEARVLTAQDGRRGLDLARAEDPDVILLDIVMPEMDGFEVCRELKADERLQTIPVLFLTAHGSDRESRIRSLEAGAEGFLSKPLDEIELVAQIRVMTKVKAANRLRRLEKEELSDLVTQRTCQLVQELAERRRVEEMLRESEEKYSTAFRTSPNVITITRVEDGAFVEVNDAFTALSGLSREEALASSSVRLNLWVDEADRAEVVAALGAGRTVFGAEYRFRGRGGEIRTGLYSAQLIRLKCGVCILSSISDITERTRLAEEKAKLEEQLRQAQKVEAIGRLAGGVAHDFNNLTAIVLGYGEMLLGQMSPKDPARAYAEQIVAAGRRSAALTRQLLAFSRRQVLLPVVLDLNALVRNLEKMLSRVIGEDIELRLELSAGSCRITADPGQIEQVLMNLVVNARDAMPRGGTLTLRTTDVEFDETGVAGQEKVVPGRYVMLTLADTGCGMDEAVVARLFEPFFTTKEKGKGTGLGLATAYGIVKQSGGYLWAVSAPGAGTTFSVCLPWTDAEPKADGVWAPDANTRGKGERILLVEDEAALRELCSTLLVGLGYQVSAAGNGPEALARVEEQGFEPDLMITDVIMPGMSGPELAVRLRRDRPGLKVLCMSGYPDGSIARHGVLEPGRSFISKPFTEQGFSVKVREVLDAKPVGAQSGCRVLMIDDDEQYRDLVRHFCLKKGCVFAGADSARAAIAALERQAFGVLLVDLNLPGTSGEAVLREIRAAGHAVPAIVLTGDATLAEIEVLRPLGVLRVLEKSGSGEPLMQAIEEAGVGGAGYTAHAAQGSQGSQG